MPNEVLAYDISLTAYLPHESDIAVNLVAAQKDAEPTVIACSVETAARLYARLHAVLVDIGQQSGTALQTSLSPVRVQKFAAETIQDGQTGDAVLVFLEGAGRLFQGALTAQDARRLAAALNDAAKPGR